MRTTEFNTSLCINNPNHKRKRFKVEKYSGALKAIPDNKKFKKSDIYRRVIFIGSDSPYFKYKDYILGRLVKIIEKSEVGGFLCEFVHEEDSNALNKAAGWENGKRKYLFDSVRLK